MTTRVLAAAFTVFLAAATACGLPATRETVPMTTRLPAAAFTALPATAPAARHPARRKTVPMTTRAFAAALTASLVAAPSAARQAAPAGQAAAPVVETAVSAATAAVGDPITVVVTVRHGPDAQVRWPDPVDAGPFEVLDPPVPQSAAMGGGVESRLELQVAAFELGELSFPSLDLEVVDAGGDATALATEAVAVTIESVGRDEGGDIRDIKGPLAIPFEVVTLLPWVAALAALAAAAAWVYRRYRRRTRPEAPRPARPRRPAHVVAREALDALEAARMLERGEIKTYHIRLSDILRVYIEGRFGVDAMEMTTGEVLDGLLRTDADRGAVADARRVLDRCDLVKFAKLRPALPECRELAPLARRVVDVTVPPEPVPAAPAAIPAEQTA